MAGFLELRLTGGADNADPNAALGGVMSSQAVAAAALNNLFRNVTPAELAAGVVLYRAIDIYNSGDAACQAVQAYMGQETTSGGTQVDFGLDATAQEAADEETAPAGVVFGHYVTGSRLDIADIAAGAAARLWLRLTVAAGTSGLANDTGTITIPYAPGA